MTYKIVWKSRSQWAGTEQIENEEEETFETREEAEKFMKELEADKGYREAVHHAAVEGQGVEGWLEIEEIKK